jgi:hypothetical protein
MKPLTCLREKVQCIEFDTTEQRDWYMSLCWPKRKGLSQPGVYRIPNGYMQVNYTRVTVVQS